MRDYELVFIVRPSTTEEDLANLGGRVQGWITNAGGEVVSLNPWGRRRLAYPIRDFREGIYFQVNFKAKPSSNTDLERNLTISEDVMRYLLIRSGD